jgi:hypothetical protein
MCPVPSGFPSKIFTAFLISPIHAACLDHLILPDLSTLITRIQVTEFSLCSFLQPAVHFLLYQVLNNDNP